MKGPSRKPTRGPGRKPPRAPSPGRNRRDLADAPAFHLSDDVIRELRATARPGKADILVKVFSQAAGAFADEDYETAVRLAEQSKHMALRAGVVRELLGLAYYRMGNWQKAARELAAFKRIAGSTEQNPVIADCYRAMGKPDHALELCNEVERKQVSDGVYYEAAIVAAGALADMGRVADAIDRIQRLDLDPDVAQEHHLRAWYVLGDLLEKKGRFTQAREYFEAVGAADPEITDAPERAARLA
jgi:tetratricopeptide (TPR) repeat protein